MSVQEDPVAIAQTLARKYRMTQAPEVVEELLREGQRWDAITRSCLMYDVFEREVGEHFPILWIEESTTEELREFIGGETDAKEE